MPDASSAPRITVWFVIAGDDFDADACTAAIGIEPSSIWRQQRSELRDHSDLNNMNWSFGVEKVREYSTDAVVKSVLDVVWPRRATIAAFVADNRLSTSVCCNVRVHQDRPVYELSPSTMSRLVDLNAEFLMDIFDHSE